MTRTLWRITAAALWLMTVTALAVGLVALFGYGETRIGGVCLVIAICGAYSGAEAATRGGV